MNTFIQTVTGPISPNKLGYCQCHEHILLSKGKSWEINPVLCIDNIKLSREELIRYRQAGGQSLVEAQPVGCNRMASELEMLSRDTGIQIIASTGFHKIIFYPENHWIFTSSQKMLEEIFLHELQQGMYIDADNRYPEKWIPAKAGIIKTALDACGLTPQYQKLFRAAASASAKTGAPVMVHIEQDSDPLELLTFFQKTDCVPEKLIFCHMDRACPDLSIHKKVCAQGVFLEYDTIGRFKYHDDHTECGILKELIEAGYGNQLLFSLDTTRARLKAYDSKAIGLDYILSSFQQQMKNHGISEQQIYKISHTNCQTALEISR